MKLNEIQDLIKFVAKSGVSEVELETKDIKIQIKTNNKDKEQVVVQQQVPTQVVAAPAPAAPVAAATVAAEPVKAAPVASASNDDSKYVTIKSPMIGTFYRTPSPDKPAFVNVGDEIAPGKVICIVEAMKLFNEVEAEIKGTIVKVLVDDISPIEYDQPLFLVDPS